MPITATPLPRARDELVIRPLGEHGRYVVKVPTDDNYFELGEQEHFLLTQLDGSKAASSVCRAFVDRFGEPFSTEDLGEFVALAQQQQLLDAPGAGKPMAGGASEPQPAH
jgi:hypothetical protein